MESSHVNTSKGVVDGKYGNNGCLVYGDYREVIGGGEVVEGARLRHELKAPGSPVISRFTRTLESIRSPRTIEESYDDGDLVGTGRWTFEALAPNTTRVSFHCKVKSNTWLMHIGFAIAGKKGHNMVYTQILDALKKKCEAAPSRF